jgi:ABC-type transport system involved in cytochrome c biogenesis permease subunit
MIPKILLFLLLFLPLSAEIPVSYKGRIRPLDSYARLWLYENYDAQEIKNKHRQDFGIKSGKASELLWQLHFFGHAPWDEAPLFSLNSAERKRELGLEPTQSHFNYNRLHEALQGNDERMQAYTTIDQTSIKALPGRYASGEWFSLKALKDEARGNFTAYSDAQFQQIREAYLKLEASALAKSENFEQALGQLTALLTSAYQSIEGTLIREVNGKSLYYPSMLQLTLETAYYRYPLISWAIALYLAGALCLLMRLNKSGLALLLPGFALHTGLLAMRWVILARPPVSNMFETVLYVPWIAMWVAMLLGLLLGRSRLLLLAASVASIILLALLKVANLSSGMENVQAVLDSHYWLTIHVLMIVASYGVFILCGVLGHLYLVRFAQQPSAKGQELGKLILQTMFIGVALLIPGTILGGVWAAESWGRFWDWDPKESWAFISAAVSLIWLHAYQFRAVDTFGLAVGAVTGLLAISFTWYGVNYLLGTGFHSYGFGSGGEVYYYLYVAAEGLFLTWAFLQRRISKTVKNLG